VSGEYNNIIDKICMSNDTVQSVSNY